MTAILFLAVALAMDAFAMSLVRGMAEPSRTWRALETGLAFGLAQGLMPLIGWALGAIFAGWLEAVDHWVAFVLLALLGGRMIVGALSAQAPEDRATVVPDRRGLLLAAIATSIDAAAAGLTLELFAPPVWLSCLLIGAVTAVLCTAGHLLGARFAGRGGRYAEILGGIVLIGLGIRILLDHLSH